MAITQLFTKKSRGFGTERNSTSIDATSTGFWIELDVTVAETHNSTTRVTTNPVQNGAEIANNAVKEAITITVVGGVTDTPFFTQAGNFGGSTGGITGAFSGSSTQSGTRTQQAYEALLNLEAEQVLLTLDTGLRSYSNMMLTAISTTTDSNNENSNIFTLGFREVFVEPDELDDGNRGNQDTIPPTEEDLFGITSTLANILYATTL